MRNGGILPLFLCVCVSFFAYGADVFELFFIFYFFFRFFFLSFSSSSWRARASKCGAILESTVASG